jgi:Tol biopolymer transport system component
LLPISAPRRLTQHDATIVGAAWTADGTSLVYGSARAPVSYLWRVSVGGALRPERIEAGRYGLSPAILPGGSRLVFVQSLFDNDVYAFEPGRPATPVASSSFTDYGPAFSPDGRRIAFESGRAGDTEEIWLADADGANPVQLTDGPGTWQGSPAWSPDGDRVAFDSRGADGFADIWTIAVNRSGLRRITHGQASEVMPAWSRDGRWIYYREDLPEGDLWRVAVEGGTPERVTRGGGLRAVEALDGRTLFFAQRDDSAPLMRLHLPDGPPQPVVDCIVSRSLAAGPDGIYYVGCPPEEVHSPMFRLDVRTLAPTLLGIAEIGGSFVPGMTVSPDGRRILYAKLVRDTADLMMIDHFR